jgi:hypothetical protein
MPMDAEERQMLRGSLARLLAETDATKLMAALEQFGWFDLFAAEPHEAVPALFETQGEALVASPALGTVMASAASASIDGDPPRSMVLPGPGTGVEPPAVVTGSSLQIDGYGLGGADDHGRLVLAARRENRVVVAAVDAGAELSVRPVEGIDPWLEFVRLEGRVETTHLVDGPTAAQDWETAVAAGRRALAHELLGLSRTMLALAVQHATERRQFGRPIGSFQAVQHRLADAKVALTAAEMAAAEAWSGPETISALLAKLWAGRTARLVGKHAQQTLGGMGFTWEHRFHRYFRRALALDSLLGSAPQLTAELGRRLATTADIPQLAPL